jgi:ribosomal protein S6--L-glutamate ligase
MDADAPCLVYEGLLLSGMDAVIPRIGASVTDYGAAIIRQLELTGYYTLTSSEALLRARDKLKCLQVLSANGIPIPQTFIAGSPEDLRDMVERLQGSGPVIIKLLESTHGVGVILAESRISALALAETFFKLNQPVILQEFIEEAAGSDVRAFVIGGAVVAAMRRQAPLGEFRSNLHRGASAEPVELSRSEEQLVLQSARLMGLEVAGVDLLRSRRGPLVMEVNASPGLEGIEACSGMDIADKIISHLEAGYQSFSKKIHHA